MIPHVLYIYIYGFWSGFIWFLWNMQRYKHIILLSSSQLVTNVTVFFKNWSKISQAFAHGMQFGDNWSLTSSVMCRAERLQVQHVQHQWAAGCFESFPFRQKLFIFVCQTTWFWWNVRHWTSSVNVHNENSNR